MIGKSKIPSKINHPAYYGFYNDLKDDKRTEVFYKEMKTPRKNPKVQEKRNYPSKIKHPCYSGSYNDLPDNDKRKSKFYEQWKKHGFDESTLWNLDVSLSELILPRLKAFREQHNNEYGEELDHAIAAFELLKQGDWTWAMPPEGKKNLRIVKKGLKVFVDNFCSLWT